MKSFAEHTQQLKNYHLQLQPDPYQPVEEYFTCQVSNMGSVMLPLLNGWYVHKDSQLTIYPDGVIAGSLKAAMAQYPELVQTSLKTLEDHTQDELTSVRENHHWVFEAFGFMDRADPDGILPCR